ncbi:MAG: chemotaxis protein CheB [Pseudomonadota bacterium]
MHAHITRRHEAIVIGVSAGGLAVLRTLLGSLCPGFSLPVIIVQHEARDAGDFLPRYLNEHCAVRVKQAEEKERILPGTVYLAPPGYHLLVEYDTTFSLSLDEPVNYARPSIDVLFETAAEVYGPGLVGVVLTGANTDGAAGLKKIKDAGGLAIVQDPETAEVGSMPRAAIRATAVDHVLPLERIGPLLNELSRH